MAWMRMMGADSVAYHRATVLARGDDHPGQALAYYASRGETPLRWGGAGAQGLGLERAVTDEQYEALFGPGGACDPTTGDRLVTTRRPGLELVVSAQKSVAELGVIGRAEDMHRIMDAERDATLAYLDQLTAAVGGRRGRAMERTATEGMIYATTRHATSRTGDPCPHDHVLVANLVHMADAQGGWKAADTALWREHLHAATMVGRVASAQRAVELGYAIAPDPGPSGRLGHWAIAGVPSEVMEAHSKRAAEIAAEVERTGHDSYRARNVAARTTRDAKRHMSVGELMPRWEAEIAEVGWSVERFAAEVDRAAAERSLPAPELRPFELRDVAHAALAPDGPLAARKVFTKRDVIVAVAPELYGRNLSELSRAVGRTLADPEAVALLGCVAGDAGRGGGHRLDGGGGRGEALFEPGRTRRPAGAPPAAPPGGTGRRAGGTAAGRLRASGRSRAGPPPRRAARGQKGAGRAQRPVLRPPALPDRPSRGTAAPRAPGQPDRHRRLGDGRRAPGPGRHCPAASRAARARPRIRPVRPSAGTGHRARTVNRRGQAQRSGRWAIPMVDWKCPAASRPRALRASASPPALTPPA